MNVKRNVVISILLFIVLIVVGSFVYHRIEGWTFLDALYFVVMTVTTVGYGDFVPKTDVGKIFTMFFSFMGIVFVFYFISITGTALFRKHLGKKAPDVRKILKKKSRKR